MIDVAINDRPMSTAFYLIILLTTSSRLLIVSDLDLALDALC